MLQTNRQNHQQTEYWSKALGKEKGTEESLEELSEKPLVSSPNFRIHSQITKIKWACKESQNMHLWLLKKDTSKKKSKAMSDIFVIIRIEALSFSLFSVRYHISQPPPGKQKLPYLSGKKSLCSTSYHFSRKKNPCPILSFSLGSWNIQTRASTLFIPSHPLPVFHILHSHLLFKHSHPSTHQTMLFIPFILHHVLLYRPFSFWL